MLLDIDMVGPDELAAHFLVKSAARHVCGEHGDHHFREATLFGNSQARIKQESPSAFALVFF